jgi:hypothetical protein
MKMRQHFTGEISLLSQMTSIAVKNNSQACQHVLPDCHHLVVSGIQWVFVLSKSSGLHLIQAVVQWAPLMQPCLCCCCWQCIALYCQVPGPEPQ